MAINMTSPQRLCLLPHCLHDSVLFFFFFSLSYFNEKNSPAGLSARLDGNFFLPPSTWFLLVTDATLTKGQTSSHWGAKKKGPNCPLHFPRGRHSFSARWKNKERRRKWDAVGWICHAEENGKMSQLGLSTKRRLSETICCHFFTEHRGW